MKKIYISPATDVIEINIHYSIAGSIKSDDVGGEGYTNPGGESGGGREDWDPGDFGGGGQTGGTPDINDLSRRGGGSVWDNAW